jgi:hypothetical protein
MVVMLIAAAMTMLLFVLSSLNSSNINNGSVTVAQVPAKNDLTTTHCKEYDEPRDCYREEHLQKLCGNEQLP